MGKTLAGSACVTTTLAVAANEFFTLANSQNFAGSVTEASNAVYYNEDVTLSQLQIRVASNTTTLADTVVTVRKNGVDTALTFTIPAGVGGTFTNTSDSVAFADGDYSTANIVVGASGAGSLTYIVGAVQVAKTTGVTQYMAWRGPVTYTAAATPWFIGYGGNSSTSAMTDQLVELENRVDAELRNLRIVVSANTRTDSISIHNRINGANGTVTFNIPTMATGTFTDDTNVDAIVDGDLFNMRLIGNSGSGNITMNKSVIEFVPTGELKTPIVTTSNLATPSGFTAATRYVSILGTHQTAIATEANAYTIIPYNCVMSNFSVKVPTNASTTDRIFYLRIDGANGNSTVTAPAATTGTFTDDVNTDSITAGESLNYIVPGSASGTMRLRYIMLWQTVTDPEEGGNNNLNSTLTLQSLYSPLVL